LKITWKKVEHQVSLHKYPNTTRSTYGVATLMHPRAPPPPASSPWLWWSRRLATAARAASSLCAQQMARAPLGDLALPILFASFPFKYKQLLRMVRSLPPHHHEGAPRAHHRQRPPLFRMVLRLLPRGVHCGKLRLLKSL